MKEWLKFFRLDDKSQRFDLPFHARLGTEFLVFLTALMTVLCLLSVTASLSLTRMAETWTSGLENTLTIEIPSSEGQSAAALKILSSLKEAEGIQGAQLMDQADMGRLLTPWLGSAAQNLEGLPLPSLITVELKERNTKIIRNVTQMVKAVAPEATIDAHEQWLTDLVRFTKTLKIVAILIMISIGLVTSLTVGGAVRSRMAIHHTELELLHIIGADDAYITRQFQRYIYWLAGKGVLLGFIICAMAVGILEVLSLTSAAALPKLNLTLEQFLALPVAAVTLLLISGFAARMTAMRVLRDMP